MSAELSSKPRRPFSFSIEQAVFALFALFTVIIHLRAGIGPGQDYHFHTFNSSIVSGEFPARAQLYRHVSLADPNSLVYHVAGQMVPLFGAHRSVVIAMLLMAYLGFPLACYYALRRQRSSVWGAIFAFPMLYTTSWVTWGYLPLVSSVSIMVLAISEFDTAFGYRSKVSEKRARVALGLCSLLCVLCFMAHSQSYSWLALLLGGLTLRAMKDRLMTAWNQTATVKEAARASFVTGLRGLLMIAPSAALLLYWNARSQSLSSMSGIWKNINFVRELSYRRDYLEFSFNLVRGPDEQWFANFLKLTLAVSLFSSLWRRTKITSFEIALLYSIACFGLFPAYASGQSIAERYLDFSYWMLPMVICSRRWHFTETRWIQRAVATCATLMVLGYSVTRYTTIMLAVERHGRVTLSPLQRLSAQVAHLPKTNAQGRPLRLGAYIIEKGSPLLFAMSYQQFQSGFAVLTGLDTPAFDTTTPVGRMQPVRHLVPGRVIPAYQPESAGFNWYKSEEVWQHFDWIFTYGRVPIIDADEHARWVELIAREGDIAVYRRRQPR